ncbi:hypothetical protein GCM10025770_20660 [Viridibacterium curvum]|uniref:Secreted protein n=1 Tax=Viridibacterium curvum TaxID=1101404 RepID=A0ABP9QPA3_9RHOO
MFVTALVARPQPHAATQVEAGATTAIAGNFLGVDLGKGEHEQRRRHCVQAESGSQHGEKPAAVREPAFWRLRQRTVSAIV